MSILSPPKSCLFSSPIFLWMNSRQTDRQAGRKEGKEQFCVARWKHAQFVLLTHATWIERIAKRERESGNWAADLVGSQWLHQLLQTILGPRIFIAAIPWVLLYLMPRKKNEWSAKNNDACVEISKEDQPVKFQRKPGAPKVEIYFSQCGIGTWKRSVPVASFSYFQNVVGWVWIALTSANFETARPLADIPRILPKYASGIIFLLLCGDGWEQHSDSFSPPY